MNTNIVIILALALAILAANAQGPLTPPPGAPTPVMKSLDQIEPRIAVNSLPGSASGMHVINQPGAYYLTASLVGTTGWLDFRPDASRGPRFGEFSG
jgi:hypothetical protein